MLPIGSVELGRTSTTASGSATLASSLVSDAGKFIKKCLYRDSARLFLLPSIYLQFIPSHSRLALMDQPIHYVPRYLLLALLALTFPLRHSKDCLLTATKRHSERPLKSLRTARAVVVYHRCNPHSNSNFPLFQRSHGMTSKVMEWWRMTSQQHGCLMLLKRVWHAFLTLFILWNIPPSDMPLLWITRSFYLSKNLRKPH